MKIKFRLISLLVLVLTISGCATHTTVRQHQDFIDTARNINSVVIIPPTIYIEKIVFSGENEQLSEMEASMKESLIAAITQKLREENLEVVEFDFDKAFAENEDFSYSITQSKQALEKAEEELYSKSVKTTDVDTFSATVGPVVNMIAEHTGAETALIVEYRGFTKSSGMMAKDLTASVFMVLLTGVAPVQATKGAAINITLVDTRSGDILWSNRKISQQLNTKIVDVVFNDFPDLEWQSEIDSNTPTDEEDNI